MSFHHHQPINVPTTGAQAFLVDYSLGERAITHHAGPVRVGGLLLVVTCHLSSSYPYPTKWGRYNMFFIML
jgi:hypothetical protein